MRKVIVKAERDALKLAQSAVKGPWPVRTGASRRSIRIRASKGPRAWKSGNISLALLVGEAGKKGDKEAGIKRPWWAFLVERGFHTGGKRVRKGGKTVGYRAMRDLHGLGLRQVRFVPGKHIVRDALRSTEGAMSTVMINAILQGIETLAGKG